MIGDAQILEPEIDRGPRHLDQRVLPVAGRGVAVKGAAQIAPLNKIRKCPRFSSGDLPLVLTEFGWDEVQTE